MLKITPYLGIIVMIISLWRNLLPKARVLLAAGLCQPDGHCSIQGQVVLRQPLSARKLCRLLARPDKPKGQNSVDLKKHVNRDTNLHRHGIMIFRIIGTNGIVDKVGIVFVTICILTTSVAIFFGVTIAPSAWCSFCPMGTLHRTLGGSKYQLKVDRKKCMSAAYARKSVPCRFM